MEQPRRKHAINHKNEGKIGRVVERIEPGLTCERAAKCAQQTKNIECECEPRETRPAVLILERGIRESARRQQERKHDLKIDSAYHIVPKRCSRESGSAGHDFGNRTRSKLRTEHTKTGGTPWCNDWVNQ